MSYYSSPCFDPADRMPNKTHLIFNCSSLVTVIEKHDGRSKTIYLSLAHLSVKEYLKSDQVFQGFREEFQDTFARNVLVKVKLVYMFSIDEKERKRTWDLEKIVSKLPFLTHAVRTWSVGASLAEEQSSVVRQFTHKLFVERAFFDNIFSLLWDGEEK